MKFTKRIVSALLCIIMLASVLLASTISVHAYSDEYDAFLTTLGNRESGNRYNIKNQYGYMGRWQLGKSALKDIGFMDASGNWTALAKNYGVTSEDTFLSTPAVQDFAVYEYHKKLWRYLVGNGASEYIGSTFNGVPVTVAGLVGAAHLSGATGVKNMLESGNVPSDANGTTALSYMQMLCNYNITLSITGTFSPENTIAAYETWKVTSDIGVKLRTGPGTNYNQSGSLAKNANARITEFETVGNSVWGKTAQGWCAVIYNGENLCQYVSGGLYTVTYNANGGSSAPAATKKSYVYDTNISTSVPVRSGYTFLGWSNSPTATQATYAAGAKYSANRTTTLYAVWRKDGAPYFSDVSTASWYFDAVMYAAENGLLLGTSPEVFSPDVAMTRVMLVTVLYRMDGSPYIEGSSPFTDVPDDNYYVQAVMWAQKNGIVDGVGNNLFDPYTNLRRQDMAKILRSYAEYKGYDVSDTGDLESYPDCSDVASYAYEHMSWAVGKSLISGADGLLLPNGYATRAQVATVIMRFIETLEN